jgi:hypothetical protein
VGILILAEAEGWERRQEKFHWIEH